MWSQVCGELPGAQIPVAGSLRCDRQSPWSWGEPMGHKQKKGSKPSGQFLRPVIKKGRKNSRADEKDKGVTSKELF